MVRVTRNDAATSEAEPNSEVLLGALRRSLASSLVALLILAPAAAGAQTLAEVAKAEEARRKTVDKPAKVYTNSDLRSDVAVPASPPAAPAPDASDAPAPTGGFAAAGVVSAASGASPAKSQAPAAAPAQRDETYWKGRINAARDAVNRSRMFLDALQSRINALTTQVISRDDPYQQASLEQERVKNLAELERVKKEIDDQTKAIAAIEDEARRAGVPPGWLR